MRRVLKGTLWAVAVLAVLLLLLLVLRNPVAKAVVESAARKRTGLPVTVGAVNVGLFPRAIALTHLEVQNAPEFGGGLFLHVPEVRVEYAGRDASEDRVHLKLLRLNLGELRVIELTNGRNNVQDLAERLKRNRTDAPRTNAPAEPSRKHPFPQIDTLSLSLGRFSYTSAARPSLSQELRLNVTNETVNNVRSLTDLKPLMTSVILKTGAAILGRLLEDQNGKTNSVLLLPGSP